MVHVGSKSFADVTRCQDLIRPHMIECLGLRFNHRRIGGDRNCLFRSVAFWVYNDENDHDRVRSEVVSYARDRWNVLGTMVKLCYPQCRSAHDYVMFMGELRVYGGQFELLAANMHL